MQKINKISKKDMEFLKNLKDGNVLTSLKRDHFSVGGSISIEIEWPKFVEFTAENMVEIENLQLFPPNIF